MTRTRAATLLLATCLALLGASVYNACLSYTTAKLPPAPAQTQQNHQFLVDFQTSGFDHETRHTTPLWATLPKQDHHRLMANMSAIAAERRWYITNRDYNNIKRNQTFWLAVPKNDADVLRRLEADIVRTLSTDIADPVTENPKPSEMLSAKLTVSLTSPIGPIALCVLMVFVCVFALAFLIWALESKPKDKPAEEETYEVL